jgi:cyclase
MERPPATTASYTGSRLLTVEVPVIASGGAGEIAHFAEALRAGASAVLAASVFHFGKFSIRQVKEALAKEGFSHEALGGKAIWPT